MTTQPEVAGSALPTLRAALAAAREQLRDVPGGALDAELLLAAAAGINRTTLYTWPERALSLAADERLQHMLAARRRGEPVAYLTGVRAFHALSLTVTPDVLIPRPETELLVDLAIGLALPAGARVLDAGCGSGAVALALKHARPDLMVLASDLSAAALQVSRANAARLGLDIAHLRGDWTSALADATLDLLVSNPPYIAAGDPALAGDIRHEPRLALTSGADGLDALRTLAANRALRPGAHLLLEHGWDQGPATADLLARHDYRNITTHRDLAGHLRVTTGQAPPVPIPARTESPPCP